MPTLKEMGALLKDAQDADFWAADEVAAQDALERVAIHLAAYLTKDGGAADALRTPAALAGLKDAAAFATRGVAVGAAATCSLYVVVNQRRRVFSLVLGKLLQPMHERGVETQWMLRYGEDRWTSIPAAPDDAFLDDLAHFLSAGFNEDIKTRAAERSR